VGVGVGVPDAVGGASDASVAALGAVVGCSVAGASNAGLTHPAQTIKAASATAIGTERLGIPRVRRETAKKVRLVRDGTDSAAARGVSG
jgi:hypothetical protein